MEIQLLKCDSLTFYRVDAVNRHDIFYTICKSILFNNSLLYVHRFWLFYLFPDKMDWGEVVDSVKPIFIIINDCNLAQLILSPKQEAFLAYHLLQTCLFLVNLTELCIWIVKQHKRQLIALRMHLLMTDRANDVIFIVNNCLFANWALPFIDAKVTTHMFGQWCWSRTLHVRCLLAFGTFFTYLVA